MDNLPKTAAMATRDITIDVVLERIQNNFRLLRTGSIDEGELRQDLEDLVNSLKEIGEELETEYTWLRDLLEEVRSEDRKALWLTQLQTDHEQFLRTKTRLMAVQGFVDGTENVVEVVYKITASRSLLGRLENPSAQRSMSQSLSKISVAQEKVFEARAGLVELTGELERRGLVEKLLETGQNEARMKAAQNAARSAVKRLTKKGSVRDKEASSGRRSSSPSDRRSTEAASRETSGDEPDAAAAETILIKPKGGIRPVRIVRADSGARKRPTPEAAGLARADSEEAKRALNDWSRWNPLAPPRLGDAVRIVKATQEEATLVRVRSLFGERRWRGSFSPSRSPNRKTEGTSWDLPASPPAQYTSATEESEHCETSYRTRNLEHLVYAGEVPPEFLREVSGTTVLQEEFSACAKDIVGPALEKRCLEALSKWSNGKDMLSEHYRLEGGESSDSAVGQPETRLVRSSVSVESIPVIRLECELRLRGRRHYLVEAWLCGDEKRLHLGDVPKTWTWRTTAWLTGIAALGVPLGYLLAGLLRG